MIAQLGGNADSVAAFTGALGKTITDVKLVNDELEFTFADNTRIALFDDGQSCCESRYMRTDDDLAYYVGAKLLDAEVLDAPSTDDDYGCHEVQFLHVRTSKGTFTMSSHNEHNGYYGGFAIRAKELPPQTATTAAA